MDVSKSLRMQSDTEKSACDHVGDQTLATQDCSHHIQAMVSFDPARMAWPGTHTTRQTPTKVNGKCQESAPLGCQSIHSTSWRPKSSENRPIFLPKFPICLSPFLFGQKPNKPGKPTSRTWCFFPTFRNWKDSVLGRTFQTLNQWSITTIPYPAALEL